MDTIKQIAVALFIVVAGGLLTFLGSTIAKKIKDLIEAAKARGILLLDIEEANKRHYEEDRNMFNQLSAQVQKLDDKVSSNYSNSVIDEKFARRDLRIDNVEERVDRVEENIVAHIDRSTATILEKLNNR